MPLEDGASPTETDRVGGRSRFRRISRSWLVAGSVLVAGVVVIAALGGFSDVPVEEQPVFALGDAYRNDLFGITVDSIEVTDTDPVTGEPLDTPVIVAEADLSFSGDEPPTRAADWLKPLDVPLAEDFVGMRSVRDGSAYPPIQPGLPVAVYYSWALPEDTTLKPGDPVRVGIYVRYVDTESPLEGVTSRPTLVGVVDPGAVR